MRKVTGHDFLFKRDDGTVVNVDPHIVKKIAERKAKEARLDTMEEKINRIEELLERLIENGK